MRVENEIPSWVRGVSPALIFFILALSAQGQGIIYFAPSQPINYGPAPTTQNLDITGSGNTDFILICDGAFGSFLNPGVNKLIVVPQTGDLDTSSLVAALNPGDVIDSNPSSLNPVFQWRSSADEPGGAPTLADQNSSGTIGNFFGKTAYIGFDLVYGDADHYGWMEVDNPLPIAAGSIVAWAYDSDPNTPILAGQVPEPGTFSLLIGGGLVLWVFRRSR